MPGQYPRGPANDLLRGLWGSLQAGAAQRLGTVEIWSDLRSNAAEWYRSAQGLPPLDDPSEEQALGRTILSEQGVVASSVSEMRGIAGQWRGAKEALHDLGTQAQVSARAIFRAPWAATTDPAVPDRYRIRTQWQVEQPDGTETTSWVSAEVEGPLTSVGDVLEAAEPDPSTESGRQLLSGLGPPSLVDYEIEQV